MHVTRWSRMLVVAALVAGLGGAAVPALARPDGSRPVKRVQADHSYFCKASADSCTAADSNHRTRVVVGTRVKWIYSDEQCTAVYPVCPGHNVKVKGHHKSATVYQDGAVIESMVFKTVGTFHYWCTHHRDQGMTGRIRVVPRS